MSGKFPRTQLLARSIITGVPLVLPVMSLLIVDDLLLANKELSDER